MLYLFITDKSQAVLPYKQHTQSAQDYNFGCYTGILFNISINDLLFFVALAFLYNFGDNNTLSAFATTVLRLNKILESQSEVVIDWFKKNKMVVNLDKFQANKYYNK